MRTPPPPRPSRRRKLLPRPRAAERAVTADRVDRSRRAGTSCTTPRYIGAPLGRCYTYVAFIGGSGGSLPPNPVQRTSATFTRCNPLN